MPLPEPGRLREFECGGRRLVLCNAEGTPYVVEAECPHAKAPLASGRLRGTVLECPLHGGKLDVRDGTPVSFPIRRPARTFPVQQQDDKLLVKV